MPTVVSKHFYEFLIRLDKDVVVNPGDAEPLGMHISYIERVTTDGVITSEKLMPPVPATFEDLTTILESVHVTEIEEAATKEKDKRDKP